ncbi:carboxylesterase/lipase family protein [Sphingobium tyrosinilyticum]|uniref:Carboxylic ester hydrolase n=1 Tax=Sphingobium tyrosinilyticum TaxID=2715436 RepID=A0ABV9F4D6_9SPHN
MAMDIDRRNFVVGGTALAGIALASNALAAGETEACFAEVRQGKLRGERRNGVDIYRAIPYAGSVSGANRFREAPPPPKWAGVRDATQLGAPAMQPRGGTFGIREPAPSEDCLFLNIWTPSGGGRGKPVMVYSHGGGFTSGSGGAAGQDGANLARENDVVVVATNHRLGLLGFLYLDEIAGRDYAGSGNRGVQDIAFALRWISRNVAAFGGDPRNVTIFGESGGGAKTSCLYAMPQAAAYFHKASIESGPGVRMMTKDAAAETTRQLLATLGIAPRDWRKLLNVPASRLLEMQTALGRSAGGPAPAADDPRQGVGRGGGGFAPVVDGHILPHHPFDPVAPTMSRDKPLIVGGNQDEQMFFAVERRDADAWKLSGEGLKQRLRERFGDRADAIEAAYRSERPEATPTDLYFAVFSDAFSGVGSNVIAERKLRQGGAPVFRYLFAYQRGGRAMPGVDAEMGAAHALDIPVKFNNVAGRLAGSRAERIAAGANMSRLWASFARTGKPSAPGVPEWPAYDLSRRPVMVIDSTCHVEDDPRPAERKVWGQLS